MMRNVGIYKSIDNNKTQKKVEEIHEKKKRLIDLSIQFIAFKLIQLFNLALKEIISLGGNKME